MTDETVRILGGEKSGWSEASEEQLAILKPESKPADEGKPVAKVAPKVEKIEKPESKPSDEKPKAMTAEEASKS